ncbi:hypothetical protein B0F90DRAFT_1812962 [Multifurca ochricompacta]|uniref:Uncharacterized protein n=1 Tax=Multifurca ochricompacta TaxID=376703 RepID=A0AAD4QTD2_9AGAM|nr:hypothetical protein B0F90DRAFT_1812962 [Multifurca ochricompacta]
MPPVVSYSNPVSHPTRSVQVQTTASVSARRRPAIDVSQGTLQGHPRAPSRADSVSSEASTSSTLVDTAETLMPVCLDDEHVMMQLDYMLPISEYPEYSIPPSPSSSFQPDEPPLVTPSSSSVNLLSRPSPTSTRPRLWLHRHKRLPGPRNSPPPSPSDPRTQSFLSSLLHARWPKTESEQPIFGQTAPRAVSPFRGKQRPPSAASMPRSILRADSHSRPRTIKSPRSLGCVKFAEQPGIWEYTHPEEERDMFEEHHPRIAWRTQNDSDEDSIITLPPPGERMHNDSFFKRFMGASNKNTKAVKGRPMISGPMPLARASSIREMKEASRSHTELLKEISAGPPKKGNKLRSLMGKYLKVS